MALAEIRAVAPVDRSPSTLDILASGGDGRLARDRATGLNRYGCTVAPRPSVHGFSSSTASSISPRALTRADLALASWERTARATGEWAALDRHVDAVREEVLDLLGLGGSSVDVILSPSGTDSQLHALYLVRAMLGTPLRTLVLASDETGSGTAFTASGRHFSDRTAVGRRVFSGRPLAGLEGVVEAVSIATNGPQGPRSLADIDEAVLDAVSEAARAGQTIMVQAMNASKLGRRFPSDDCLATIRRRWAGTAQIVVDACQMRIGRPRLRQHLAWGDMVLVTGSKFFTGPAFSGALLVPQALMSGAAAASLEVGAGLADYASRQDWPRRWAGIRGALPCRTELGPWLRWEAVLAEMGAYFAVPWRFRQRALRAFATAAEELQGLGCRSPVPPQADIVPSGIDEDFAIPTIFPFVVGTRSGPISPAMATALYRDLNRDVAGSLPPSADAALRDLASCLCHVGQPVALTVRGQATAALRVSADARFVSSCWSPDPVRSDRRIDEHIRALRRAFAKLEDLHARRPA